MKTLCPSPSRGTRCAANRGFSLIEVLVAALLLMVIALGLVPLFTRAMLDNANGRDATTATNIDRSQLETQNAIPFDFAQLIVPNGQEFLETNESFSRGDPNVENDSLEVWSVGVPTNLATRRWTRRTRIRQSQYKGLDGTVGELGTPQSGGIAAAFVNLKEIEVTVQGTNRSLGLIGNLLGGSPELTFRLRNSFS